MDKQQQQQQSAAETVKYYNQWMDFVFRPMSDLGLSLWSDYWVFWYKVFGSFMNT